MCKLTPPTSGSGSSSAPSSSTGCPRKVVTINVKVPATQSVRGTGAVASPITFHTFSSSSNSKDLSANAPTVLVRNCAKIQLEAVTSPPNQTDVAWAVVPNPKGSPAPSASPGSGLKSTLTTDAAGGFSVSATLDGTTVYWNVVFVDVQVTKKQIRLTKKNFKNLPAGAGSVAVYSGEFDNTQAKKCAMWVQVKVKLYAGGDKSLDTYCDRVHAGFPQNLLNDTAGAQYDGGGQEQERIVVPPKPASPVVDPSLSVTDLGYPILDRGGSKATRATGGDTIFLSKTASAPATGLERTVTTCDSPRVVFDALHPEFGAPATKKVKTVSGVNAFRVYLAAYSDDAKYSYVVFGKADWTADYGGDVDWSSGAPVWTRTTGSSTGKKMSLIKGGKEAQAAGCEVRPPVFLDLIIDAR